MLIPLLSLDAIHIQTIPKIVCDMVVCDTQLNRVPVTLLAAVPSLLHDP